MSTLTAKLRFISLNWLYWLMILLAIGGIGVSVYLMWGYTVSGATLACGGSHGCETVKNSAYSSLLGIPLPLLGLVAYLAILILLILQGQIYGGKDWLPYIALAIFGISLTGVLYSAYLTYLELFVIDAICRWCFASALIMAATFLFVYF